MSAVIVLTEQGHRRVGRAVSRVEQRLFGDAGDEGGRLLPDTAVLKVRAGAANANGYPARFQAHDDDTGGWVDYDVAEVRVKDANGRGFSDGQYVHDARPVGTTDGGVVCFVAGAEETAWVRTTVGAAVGGRLPVVRKIDAGSPSTWQDGEDGWLQHAAGLPLVANWPYFARRSNADFQGKPLWTTSDCCSPAAGDTCPDAPDGLCLTLASDGDLDGLQVFIPPDPAGAENAYQALVDFSAAVPCLATPMPGGCFVRAYCTLGPAPGDPPGWTVLFSWGPNNEDTIVLTANTPGGAFPVGLAVGTNSSYPPFFAAGECTAEMGTTLSATIDLFTGSGTCDPINGTGGGGDPVTTAACPDDPINANLTAGFVNVGGAPGIDGGSVPISYYGHVSGADVWVGNAFLDGQYVYVYLFVDEAGNVDVLVTTLAGGGFMTTSGEQTHDCGPPFTTTLTMTLSDSDPHYPGAVIAVTIT